MTVSPATVTARAAVPVTLVEFEQANPLSAPFWAMQGTGRSGPQSRWGAAMAAAGGGQRGLCGEPGPYDGRFGHHGAATGGG